MVSNPVPYGVGHAIKTAPVIGEVIDVQLREAAWSSMARLRQLACPTASLVSLCRWEKFLCGHMAGLASVINTRLLVRLSKLMREPEDLASEAFVAALLLLRCGRQRFEAEVLAAWQDATCPDTRRYVGLAIIHGGLHQESHKEALARALLNSDATVRRSAATILAARGWPARSVLRPLARQAQHDADVALTVLELMAEGAWPLDARPLARALQEGGPDLRHAAEQVLLHHAPLTLAERARAQLDRGEDPSLLSLEAMAGLVGGQPHDAADLARLGAASHRGRLGPLAVHALGLTGLGAVASHMLQLIATTPSPQLQDAAVEAFGAITGVEDGAAGSDRTAAHRAQDLQQAWALRPPAQRAPSLFGGPRTAACMAQAAPLMQVGRWQSYRRLLRMRSGNTVRLSSWALMEQQLGELDAQAPQADRALSLEAPGLRPNPLTAALARLGCNRVLPLPSPLEGAWV